MKHQGHQILMMGVSGSGKTSVGKQLAKELNCDFLDADDFHTPLAKAMMAAGTPLTEKERGPWLSILCEQLLPYSRDKKSVVLAVSGLKRTHRKQLKSACENDIAFLLDMPESVLQKRLEQRTNHFFSNDLLVSQLLTIEMPTIGEDAAILNGNQSISTLVAMCKKHIEG